MESWAGAPLQQACFRVRGKDLGCLGSNSRKPQQGFQQESESHSFQDSPCLFPSIRAGELVMAGTGVMAKKTGRRGHSVKYFKRRDIHGTLGGWNVDVKGRQESRLAASFLA